jgi:hypothetical protein
MMLATRRGFLAAAAAWGRADAPLVIPVHRVTDRHAQCTRAEWQRYWGAVWPEAVRDLGRCGIALDCTSTQGEIRPSPGGLPMFAGLRHGVLNLVVTSRVPPAWDQGRSLAGLTTLHQGFCLCLNAVRFAHPHQAPYLSVNTTMHELLHALLGDVFVDRPKWYESARRETRTDWLATRVWLSREGSAVRRAAGEFLRRLKTLPAD